MKKNFISAIAGWKSAALLALVAMVAAVAFSGVLTNTESADAQAAPSGDPGETVTVAFTNTTEDRFRISTDSEGSATFVFNGGQALRCANNAVTGCDVNDDSDTAGISVQITIDEDSPIGEIYVQQITRSGTGEVGVQQEVVVTVTRPNPAVAIQAANAPKAAISKDATGTGTLIVVKLVNASAAGIAGEAVQVTTTRGGLTLADAVAYSAGPPEVLARPANAIVTGTTCLTEANGPGGAACTLTTTAAAGAATPTDTSDDQVAGLIAVRLRGNGGTGTAEVVFRHLASGLSRTVNVVLHGPAAAIESAVADQSTIAQGGSTFIVVTMVDADGNPAVGEMTVDFQSNKPLVPAIVPPEVPAGTSANRLSYSLNVDRDLPGRANDVPACGDHPNEDDTNTADVDESEGSIGAAAGTNTAGKCAIQVTAPAETGLGDGATRGTHTLTVGTDNVRIATVNVEVEVGGAPASIETDAPARVDSLSSTKVTVTVLDDEGVRVGAVPITVTQVEGSGNADDVPGGMTSDGRGSFTFLAPLSAGEAVFLIRAGDPAKGQQIQDTVTLAIGEAPAEEPEGPAPTWNNELVSGQNLVVWNGADGADASEGAAEGVSAIWSYNTGSGSWDGYFPSAADVPGGNTLTSLSNGQAYVVIVD